MTEGLLVLHVLGVAAWLGANVTQFAVNGPMIEDRGPVAARWLRTTAVMSKTIYMPAAILILITGILLVVTSDADHAFSDPFVSIGFLMIIVGAVVGITVLSPQAERAADAFDADDGDTADSALARIRQFGSIDTVLLVVTIWAMATKLGT
ncbi:hypothetical protein BMS3Bbin02_00501 [bacterium BMS3Bbin02]|nr:hypothetical protein BMS3Bbin02_00501 [bacterium BMS3Bbin02]